MLSTSQTSFSGLSETIPILQPWHVRLLKGGKNTDAALMSQSEVIAKRKEWSTATDQAQKPRWEQFGHDKNTVNIGGQAGGLFNVVSQQAVQREQHTQSLMNRYSNTVPAAFGNAEAQSAAAATDSVRFGSAQPTHERQKRIRDTSRNLFLDVDAEVDEELELAEDVEEMGFGLFDSDEVPANSLAFEAGAWEETGMTTTYDVPGSKTLSPSNSTIKHKIAKIDFRNVIFSHIVIGKLRQVAFLKARLRNSSKIALLKGPLGLTLDGSFLGQATFPRCSAGESFSLPLGVDPAINISYSKPTVRRSQSGIFNKEDSNVFTRTVIITNTKQNAQCELTVLDQVPVSEDERLRIEITSPRGLKAGGDGVRTGSSVYAGLPVPNTGKSSAKEVRASVYGHDGKEIASNSKWGSAVATAKKNGEVSWNVKLNPGQGVKLVLEYEAAFPGGESMVGVNGTQG